MLYRGLHESRYLNLTSILTPKESLPFVKPPKWGIMQWDASTWDASAANAVIEHQHHQAGLPTSGLSTTPSLERARFYALGRAHSGCGYIVSFDRAKLKEHGVSQYIVNEMVPNPAIPEDNEVILVAPTFGPIPETTVIEVVKVCA